MSKVLKVLMVLVPILAIGVIIGLMSSGSGGSKPDPKPDSGHATSEPDPGAGPSDSTQAPVIAPPRGTNDVAMVSPAHPVVPDRPSNAITNWEERLDEILGNEVDEAQKARQMAEILPKLPEDGQVEVAQHLSNLVPDEDYGLISGFLTNSALPEAVLDVLIADSLNRPNAVKLPLLLDVARDSNNPKAPEAREILELFLEEDYGNDWPKWQSKVQEWIHNNPD